MEALLNNDEWFSNHPLEKKDLEECLTKSGLCGSEYWMGHIVKIKVIKYGWAYTHDNLKLKLEWLSFP